MRMAMKREINIALSQAGLRCENGLQFVRQILLPTVVSYQPIPFWRIPHITNRHLQSGKEKEKKKKSLFLRQIIKPQLHGAAFIMCFSVLLSYIYSFELASVTPLSRLYRSIDGAPMKPPRNRQNGSSISAEGGENGAF